MKKPTKKEVALVVAEAERRIQKAIQGFVGDPFDQKTKDGITQAAYKSMLSLLETHGMVYGGPVQGTTGLIELTITVYPKPVRKRAHRSK